MFIYFFSDAPHLVKTARNCLFHSGFGKHSRPMWNGGNYLFWEYIAEHYHGDLNRTTKLLQRLTFDHIELTIPFSVMRVNLAAQILSKSVALVSKNFVRQRWQALQGFMTCLTASLTAFNSEAFQSIRKN